MLKSYNGQLIDGKFIFDKTIPIYNGNVVLIIEESSENYPADKKDIIQAFENIRGMWKDKDDLDPMEYQKQIREEWER